MTKVVLDTKDVPINMNVKIDEASIRKELENKVKSIIQDKVDNFFGVSSHWTTNHSRKMVKGEGLLAIEEKVINEWVSIDFQVKMQKYFNDNFERVMEEAMRTALQHKANKFVFNQPQTSTKD